MMATRLQNISAVLVFAVLTGCNTQMVTTSNLYSDQRTPSTSNGESTQSAGNTVRPVLGTPYYLPQTVIKVNVTGALAKPGDPLSYAIVTKIVGIETQADSSQTYLLEIHTEDATDDIIGIGVNTKGLLQTVNATSTDRSGDILKKLAETAAAVMSQAAGTTVKVGGEEPKPKPCYAPGPFSIDWSFPIDNALMSDTIDPADSTKMIAGPRTKIREEIANRLTNEKLEAKPTVITFNTKRLSDAITDAMGQVPDQFTKPTASAALTLTIPPEPLKRDGGKSRPTANEDNFRERTHPWPDTDNPANWAPGIRFRMPMIADISYEVVVPKVNLGSCDFSARTSINNQRALILDPGYDYIFDMSRTPLVKSAINLTVTDGILTAATVTRDSPALAAVSLPLELLNILLSPITTLLNGTPGGPGASKAGG